MRREKKRVSPFPRELPVELVLGFPESTEQVPQIWRAIKARAHEQKDWLDWRQLSGIKENRAGSWIENSPSAPS